MQNTKLTSRKRRAQTLRVGKSPDPKRGHMKRRKQRTRRITTKRRPHELARQKHAALRTADEFFAKPKQFQEKWTQSTHVVSDVRATGISLRQAARKADINPRTVLQLTGTALRKQPNGRYVARKSDKLLRILVLPTPEGLREVATRDSREASRAAEYWNAVHRYLATGDASAIHEFDGKEITDAIGSKVPLLTDLKELDRQGDAGNLSFETIYAR